MNMHDEAAENRRLRDLLRELLNARPLLLYGDDWIKRIEATLAMRREGAIGLEPGRIKRIETRPIEARLRELCKILEAKQTVPTRDITPMLHEVADLIRHEWDMLLKLDHCIQSTWKAVPKHIAEEYANDETVASEDRLARAVAYMAGHMKEPTQ